MRQKTKVASEVGVGLDSVSRAVSSCRSNSGFPAQ